MNRIAAPGCGRVGVMKPEKTATRQRRSKDAATPKPIADACVVPVKEIA
jgi:hypothetical protein